MFFGLGPLYTFLIILGVLLVSGIKFLKEYERGVIFRLGRLVDPRGPGIIYVIPIIERMFRVNLDKYIPGWQHLFKDDLNQRIQELVLNPPETKS